MVATSTSERAAPAIAPGDSGLRTPDGLVLAVDAFGDARAPAIVFAHGFGQTRGAWAGSARALSAAGWRCITADARGHGESGWRDDGNYDFDQFIGDLVQLARLAARPPAPGRPILVGASMGGLLGIMAQARADAFRALVLVDITPRWETAGVERILAFMRAHPDGFDSLDAAADAIAHYLPQRGARRTPEKLRPLLVPLASGRLRWHWDARLLDRIAHDSERQQAALLDAARRIRVPTLLISGANSDVVSDTTIAEFLACVPHARHVRLPEATHMVAGDRNDAFTAAVREFVENVRGET